MKTIHRTIIASGLAAFAAVAAVDASAAVFTDRGSFLAAAGSVSTETFESAPLVGNTAGGAVPSIDFADFSVSSSPTATKVVDADHFYGTFNTTPGGKNYLYLDTDQGLVGSTATFTFKTVQHAIGFDYTGFNETGSTFNVTIDGGIFALAPTPTLDSTGFWGFTSATGVTSFKVSTSTDSGYGLDQVTFGAAVPEPGTWALMLGGLGLLGVAARRKSKAV